MYARSVTGSDGHARSFEGWVRETGRCPLGYLRIEVTLLFGDRDQVKPLRGKEIVHAVRSLLGGAVAALTEYDRLVDELGIEHRAKAAMRSLMAAGRRVTPAVRRGLRHADPRVRARCCDVLDHFLDADAIPELMESLRPSDAGVRARAMHALACDRC
jgi:hypothetical protein